MISTIARARVAAAATVIGLIAFAIPGNAVAPALATGCPASAEPGYSALFDGTATSLTDWKQSGPGGFVLGADCTLTSSAGLGLYWYAAKGFRSYTLKLDWKLQKVADNSGIFVGFTPNGNDTHNRAISHGYEVQIDQLGRNDGAAKHITGAIYDIQGPNRDTRTEVSKPLDWNEYEITVDSPKITVRLNGVVVNEFLNVSPRRDLTAPSYIGLQNHGEADVAQFRDIRIKEIAPGTGGGGTGAIPLSFSSLRNNVGIDQGPTSAANFDGNGFSYSGLFLREKGVTPGSKVTSDGLSYTWPNGGAGSQDNVNATGQAVSLTPAAGATKLGFLGASTNGPSTATFVLNYLDAEGMPLAVEKQLTFSDWTLNGGTAAPSTGNTKAISTRGRAAGATNPPETIGTHVFSVTVPLDPAMRLQNVVLPKVSAGQIHLFDVTTG